MVDQTLVNVFHFEKADVEANHKGYLTARQSNRLRRVLLVRSLLVVIGVLVCVGVGIGLFSNTSQGTNATLFTLAGLLLFVLAVVMLVLTGPRLMKLMRDYNEGSVSVVRGKAAIISAANILAAPKIKVQEIVLNIPANAVKEFSDHSRYNIYYVPHSKMIVAAEISHKQQ